MTIFVFTLAGAGLLWAAIHPTLPGDRGYLIFAVSFLITAFLSFRHKQRARLLANYTGIYWIGLSGWRSVKWEEITDYYEIYIGRMGLTSFIVTPHHRFMLSENGWTNVSILRACVQQRATRAQARAWRRRSFGR